MLITLMRMEKMSMLCCKFTELGMLAGTTSSYMATIVFKDELVSDEKITAGADEDDEDSGAVAGTPPTPSFAGIKLSSRTRTSYNSYSCLPFYLILSIAEHEYPNELYDISDHIDRPEFPLAFRRFLYRLITPTLNSNLTNTITRNLKAGFMFIILP